MINGEIKTPMRLTALFLLPGLLVEVAYAFLASPILRIEFPSTVLSGLAGLIILVPVEIGIILFHSKKEFGI
ncbi:hypothetical protein J2Z35_000957 [Acetoanaerobium pronyense]|uniref:Uncharacterized protein n=1 Tax=Acetoanaerobium pronyense TaxID=1482736 RepID=A0ABS4KH99_9FIRM|nr:hypothetical protein [Acetoanaerobium pronyense]MBP2027163.1 hypothetical protein [Acetoanaerobium pronyense]